MRFEGPAVAGWIGTGFTRFIVITVQDASFGVRFARMDGFEVDQSELQLQLEVDQRVEIW